jgi:DNA ligase D-like protein (predicted 3'-phosphoesterase)
MAGGADDDDLARYRSKRDFERTDEPSAGRPGGDAVEGNRFVVQHHDASTEHYDLRLEHDGVLLSWAVPKGPSTDPRDKRLAVRTEDHPVDYADFEGSIPADEYGGGSVIVWDRGTWENTTSGDDGPVDVDAALADGHLSFTVEASKLQGGYVLQRFRPEEDQWLLVKRDDHGADARRNPTSTQPESVLSGDTVRDVAGSDTDGTSAAGDGDPESGSGT